MDNQPGDERVRYFDANHDAIKTMLTAAANALFDKQPSDIHEFLSHFFGPEGVAGGVHSTERVGTCVASPSMTQSYFDLHYEAVEAMLSAAMNELLLAQPADVRDFLHAFFLHRLSTQACTAGAPAQGQHAAATSSAPVAADAYKEREALETEAGVLLGAIDAGTDCTVSADELGAHNPPAHATGTLPGLAEEGAGSRIASEQSTLPYLGAALSPQPHTTQGTALAPASVSTSQHHHYTRPETPFALASTGDVRLLSFNWLVAQANASLPLSRRQDLPEEAFADVASLRAAHARLPPSIAAAVLPMVSISYCWLEAAHPDASGEQLRHIIDTLRPHARQWREWFSDMGVFLDWGSLHQKDPALFDASETPEGKPEEEREAFRTALREKRAVYGGAAYEASRSTEEYAAFHRALKETMDVWWAHALSPQGHPPCARLTLRPPVRLTVGAYLPPSLTQVRAPDDRDALCNAVAVGVHGASVR